MFKIQIRHSGFGVWNLAALPTSLQIAAGQARVARREPVEVEVRLVEARGAQEPVAHPVDIKI